MHDLRLLSCRRVTASAVDARAVRLARHGASAPRRDQPRPLSRRRRRAARSIRRGGDQSRPVGSRLGLARRGGARSRGRIVHRRAGGAADEAVHDFHERRSRARAHPPRGAARGRARAPRGEPPRVGRARRARSRARGDGARAAAGRRRAAGAPARRIWRRRKRSATRPPNWRGTRARRSPSCSIAWPRARASRNGAARRASCRPRAGRCCSTPRSSCRPHAPPPSGIWPRAKRAVARDGYQLTLSGPWPPYSFIQD